MEEWVTSNVNLDPKDARASSHYLGRIFMKDTCKIKLELPVQGQLFHRCPKRVGAKLGFEGLNPGRLIPGSQGRWRMAIDEGLRIVNCRTIRDDDSSNLLLRQWSRRRRRIISYCCHFHSYSMVSILIALKELRVM